MESNQGCPVCGSPKGLAYHVRPNGIRCPVGDGRCPKCLEHHHEVISCHVAKDLEANERARDGLTFEYRELDQR